MAMPKATVNEDDRFVPRKDYIGAAGQSGHMLSETISLFMEIGPYFFLYSRVFTVNLGHQLAALFER
jgi:hypothetical protein